MKTYLQFVTHTEWRTIILWRGLAELAGKYTHKGSLVHIEGKNRTRHYEDKQGNKRYVTEIIGDQIILLDKKENQNNAYFVLYFYKSCIDAMRILYCF